MAEHPSTPALPVVMVTGGRGFIGSHLVRLLSENGHAVVSVDTRPAPAVSAKNVGELVVDIRDRDAMAKILGARPLACIFDLASFTEVGLSREKYQRNLDQTEAMVEYCRTYAVPKYIFFSTQFVFRRKETLPYSEEDFAPFEAYGESKVLSERYIRCNLPSEQWLILRPTYIWGPGLNRFRDGLLYRLARGQLLVSNSANAVRHYGYVETVAAQTLDLSRRVFADLPHKVYYVSDEAIPIEDFCRNLLGALGTGRVWRVPTLLIRFLGLIGSAMQRIGLKAPINNMQARENTTNFPVPIRPTLALTGITTDLPVAARKTVVWASRDPAFRAMLKRRQA